MPIVSWSEFPIDDNSSRQFRLRLSCTGIDNSEILAVTLTWKSQMKICSDHKIKSKTYQLPHYTQTNMPTSFGDFFKPNKDLYKFDANKTFTLKAKAADKTVSLFVSAHSLIFFFFPQRKIRDRSTVFHFLLFSFFFSLNKKTTQRALLARTRVLVIYIFWTCRLRFRVIVVTTCLDSFFTLFFFL